MKILYGVQGTGHGHLVRSAAMVHQLRRRGHEVHCLLSGRAPERIAGVERFAPYTALRGFTGVARGGSVRVGASAARLRIGRFFRDVAGFDVRGIELVVTDYEPAAAWIARRHGLPSIGLGHLYAFQRPLPLPARTAPARLVVGRFTALYTPVRHALGLHWHAFGGANLPPTIPPEVVAAAEVRDDKVLVYLPGEDEEAIAALGERLPRLELVAYRPIAAPRRRGNVVLKPYEREGFVADLADAGGVITNAGFSLPSEALHLGRRLLVKPIRRHPEQYLNGHALRELGLATVVRRLSADAVRRWLDSPPPPAMQYPDVTRELVEWIEGARWDRTDELVAKTWSRVTWTRP